MGQENMAFWIFLYQSQDPDKPNAHVWSQFSEASIIIPQVSFNCSCLPGYTGRLCENEIDYCETANCQNGATCKSSVKLLDYECECVNGYDGKSATF